MCAISLQHLGAAQETLHDAPKFCSQELPPAAITLPCSIFTQEIVLRKELTPLLSYLANNRITKIPDEEILMYVHRITYQEMLQYAYSLLFFIKLTLHFQRSHYIPARLSLAHYGQSHNNTEVLIENEIQQKISIAEIIELLERVQEDLQRAKTIDRSDKKEIFAILLARHQHLERKLKELGILHYTPTKSSSWNKTLFKYGIVLSLITILTAVGLSSLDSDAREVTIPSSEQLKRNIQKIRLLLGISQPQPLPEEEPHSDSEEEEEENDGD